MKHILPLPDLETLRTLFNYDPETGVLTWRTGRRAGQPCGYLAGKGMGHLRVKIGLTHYRVHRVIWVLYYGTDIPNGYVIDHIDRDPSNNRIGNLRIASVRFNNGNSERSDIAKEKRALRSKHELAGKLILPVPVTINYPDGTSVVTASITEAGRSLGVDIGTIRSAYARGRFGLRRLRGVTVEIRETRTKSRTNFKKKQTKQSRVL